MGFPHGSTVGLPGNPKTCCLELCKLGCQNADECTLHYSISIHILHFQSAKPTSKALYQASMLGMWDCQVCTWRFMPIKGSLWRYSLPVDHRMQYWVSNRSWQDNLTSISEGTSTIILFTKCEFAMQTQNDRNFNSSCSPPPTLPQISFFVILISKSLYCRRISSQQQG